MAVGSDHARAVERIERARLRCVLGMRFYFAPDVDPRPHVLALRAATDAVPRGEPLSTIEHRHKKRLQTSRLTPEKEAQLDRWLRGPFRQALAVHLAGRDGALSGDAFGFRVDKPSSEADQLAFAYVAWPASWALARLEALEALFLRLLEELPARVAHFGPMVVESPEWPEGVSLGELVRRTAAACADFPEWDVLDLEAPIDGLAGVSFGPTSDPR